MNKVIKRDGNVEDFDTGKIERIAKAAGLNDVDSQKVAKNVAEWVLAQGKPVQTVDIRNEVVNELQKVNSYAANLYLWDETSKYKQDKV